jgi:hypothetical protein
MYRACSLLLLSLTACATTPLAAPSVRPLVLAAPGSTALVVVRVRAPWWAPRGLITGRFVDAIPEYAAIPGLEHKSFTHTEDGRFGGVYRWRSDAEARAWFTPAWFERVRQSRGVEPEVVTLRAPWGFEGVTFSGEPLTPAGLGADVVVTWARVVLRAGVDVRDEALTTQLRALAEAHGQPSTAHRLDLVRTATSGTDAQAPAELGVLTWWPSREAADAFWTPERRRACELSAQGPLELVWLDAPVILDRPQAAAKDGAR